MNNIYPKCSLCGGIPSKGLYDGFRLKGKFICSACEQNIITGVPGSVEYQHNIRNIRTILYC